MGVDSTEVFAMPYRAICASLNAANQIQVFNADIDSKNQQKALRIFGSQGQLAPNEIAADFAHGEIFSANDLTASVTTYPASSTGDVAPTRVLGTPESLWSVIYDPTDDRLLTVSPDYIFTYDRLATDLPTGLATPLRKLTLPGGYVRIHKAVLSGPAHGDLLFAPHINDPFTIYVFHRTDGNGDTPVAPRATITTPVSFSTHAIVYAPDADELLVGDYSAGVVGFAASSVGAATTSRELRGDQTGLANVTSLALDSARGLLYVADAAGKISTFSSTFSGTANVPPVAVLSGPLTRLGNAINSMQVDAVTGKLVVQSADEVLTFPGSPSGNVAPSALMGPGASGIARPGGLVFDGTPANSWSQTRVGARPSPPMTRTRMDSIPSHRAR
jgi:hypothetical protein